MCGRFEPKLRDAALCMHGRDAQIADIAKSGGQSTGDIHQVMSRRSAAFAFLPFVHPTEFSKGE